MCNQDQEWPARFALTWTYTVNCLDYVQVSEGYDPRSFSKELEKIENLCKALDRIEEILHQANS